jgi:UDP-N-acetyl-D-mannosaminuronic acid transferase (WecB/TagA/CpsF family)
MKVSEKREKGLFLVGESGNREESTRQSKKQKSNLVIHPKSKGYFNGAQERVPIYGIQTETI